MFPNRKFCFFHTSETRFLTWSLPNKYLYGSRLAFWPQFHLLCSWFFPPTSLPQVILIFFSCHQLFSPAVSLVITPTISATFHNSRHECACISSLDCCTAWLYTGFIDYTLVFLRWFMFQIEITVRLVSIFDCVWLLTLKSLFEPSNMLYFTAAFRI